MKYNLRQRPAFDAISKYNNVSYILKHHVRFTDQPSVAVLYDAVEVIEALKAVQNLLAKSLLIDPRCLKKQPVSIAFF